MRRLIMSHLIWIYAVCKSLLLSPMAVKELNALSDHTWFIDMSDKGGGRQVP